jgi:hypothetical protein
MSLEYGKSSVETRVEANRTKGHEELEFYQ